jgi:hypothetical protein
MIYVLHFSADMFYVIIHANITIRVEALDVCAPLPHTGRLLCLLSILDELLNQ